MSHTRAALQKGWCCLAGRAQPLGPLCWPCFDPAPQSSSSTAVVLRVSSTVAAGHCTSSECDVQAAPVTGEWACMTYSSVPLRFTAGRSLQRLQNTTSASLPHRDAYKSRARPRTDRSRAALQRGRACVGCEVRYVRSVLYPPYTPHARTREGLIWPCSGGCGDPGGPTHSQPGRLPTPRDPPGRRRAQRHASTVRV